MFLGRFPIFPDKTTFMNLIENVLKSTQNLLKRIIETFFCNFFSTEFFFQLGHRKIFETEKIFFAQINSESSKTYRKSL